MVIDTVFAPTVPAGVTAVTVVGFTTLTEVAATPPIVTELAPVRFVPVIVIAVPPLVDPVFGLTDEIVGSEPGPLATRNPMRLPESPGVTSLRPEERAMSVSLFHEPPRRTRPDPLPGPVGFVCAPAE